MQENVPNAFLRLAVSGGGDPDSGWGRGMGHGGDRVGQGHSALGPDGALDGTLTAPLSAAGGRTITGLRLDMVADGGAYASAGGRPLPNCEALAAYLFARIASRLPRGVELERVRIAEDATLYGDCTGLA
mgnify:CR=1 FL=1